MTKSASEGPFLEDLEVGLRIRSRLGRTVSEADNVWFTCITMNTNQAHFNHELASRSPFQRTLVNSTFTLALVTGLSVADTSENAIANLGWSEVTLPHPVYCGDTLWAETEVTDIRESRSRRGVGIVEVRTRGVNQREEVVIEFRRTFMLPGRDAAATTRLFPETPENWRV